MLKLLKLNLQFFSADTGGEGGADQQAGEGGQAGGTDDSSVDNEKSDSKTFTQEDVNNIATREARKAQEKLFKDLGIEDFEDAKEGMKKFQEWQDAQKTDADKQAEALTNLEKKQLETATENATLKAQLDAVKLGVNPDSVVDVVTLANNLVSDEVDMQKAITQVIEKYPHFAETKQGDTIPPPFSTGKHSSQKGNTEPSSLSEALSQHFAQK